MDNCPHQTVVVASAEAAGPLEAELTARRFMFERLPFHRPYHTPLFEPFMGPLAGMFEGMSFRTPQTTLYSCTTARPFPEDPDEIRRLALAHWASPVEFTGMIRAMHDDGVRIFVEVGPRGNLTAFVEDILRGRPFLAVPCDTPRRSGLTQLNHLAAQLTAHHVPLRLEHLYARRQPQKVEWRKPASQPPAAPSSRLDKGTDDDGNGHAPAAVPPTNRLAASLQTSTSGRSPNS
jgi:acyl transferase domain-containing protein